MNHKQPKRIKEKRTQLGLSQRDLAVKIGMNHQKLMRIENGKQQMKLPDAIKIAKALDIELVKLTT